MQILKLLNELEKLETTLSAVYKRFSELFRDDAEASIFFNQMSVDETAHADLIRFERRMVRADPTHFGEVEVDNSEIEKILSSVSHLLTSAEGLTVEKALEISIGIENSAADQHYITAITLSNPDAAKLFRSLTSFDCRHFLAVEDFARKRGFAFELKTTEYMKSCRLNVPRQEERPSPEQVPPPRPVDVPQEFIDRINYFCIWHKNIGYYKLLGTHDYATEPEIRQAYHRMAKEFHPDCHLDFPDDLRQKLNTIFSQINIAYSTLMVPEKRREYDRTLRSRRGK